MSRKGLVFFLLFFSVLKTVAMRIDYDNLKTLIEEKNSRVKSIQFQIKAAEIRTGRLARSFLPNVELFGSQESFKSGSAEQKTQPVYGAEANVNLFNGGRSVLESEISDLMLKGRRLELQRTVIEELAQARRLYWEVVFLKEKNKLLEAMVQINANNLKLADKRIKSGIATLTDRFEFEMKDVDLKRELQVSNLNIEATTKEFSIVLGTDETEKLELSESAKYSQHSHDIEAELSHDHKHEDFLLKELEVNASVLDTQAKIRKQSVWPTLDAFVSYNQYNQKINGAGPESDPNQRNESVLGIRFKINLSDGYEGRNESQALQQEILANAAMMTKQRQELSNHFTTEVKEILFLHDQFHLAEQNIVRAEKYYELTMSEYARGVKNSPDVLGASDRLFEIKLKSLIISKDFQIAKSHVLSKLGR